MVLTGLGEIAIILTKILEELKELNRKTGYPIWANNDPRN